MLDIRKKTKLVGLLRKLGEDSYVEESIINDIVVEMENIKKNIPDKVDISPYFSSVRVLESKHSGLLFAFNGIQDKLKSIQERVTKDMQDGDNSILESIADLGDIRKKLKKLLIDVNKLGGGTMPRQISINGTVVATRYADINLLGSGVTFSSINNDTTHKTDITFFASGGGSGFQQPLSGGLTGTNTWLTAPNVIVVDNVPKQKLQSDGITANWTGTTTTVLAVVPTYDIFSSA